MSNPEPSWEDRVKIEEMLSREKRLWNIESRLEKLEKLVDFLENNQSFMALELGQIDSTLTTLKEEYYNENNS